MIRIKRRRTLIRLFSYATAAFAVAVGLAVTGFWMSYGLRMNIEYSYQRSLSELADHMSNINVALLKAKYAGTTPQLVGIASEIRSESTAAKAALSEISVSDVNFESTSKYISQVGDYANSLSMSITENRKLTSSDRNTINLLSTNSSKLAQQLNDLVADVQSGKLTLFKSERAINNLEETKTKSVPVVQSGFQSIENNLSSLPSLIYDGPFSDNVLKKLPELTKNKPQISREDARGVAARFLGVNAKTVANDGETAGNLPTYNFKCGTKSIFISKLGGYAVRVLDSRAVPKLKLDAGAAAEKADAFLKSRGINSMAKSYYLVNNNICVINYAYVQSNVTCYTDLMKVGVALDNGDIVSFDQTGFIMNHKNRTFPKIKITSKYAQSLLSPAVKPQKETLALVPVGGTGEALCYEFKCKADDGTNVIDYFNAENGNEQQVLILMQTPGGILVM